MMRCIWRKEWRAHRVMVMVCWLLMALLFASVLYRSRNLGSSLEAFRVVVIITGIILPFALINRLVVSEYRGQTQFFLETLPVTRLVVVTAKWLMGLMLLLIPLLVCLAITLYEARAHAVITGIQLQWISLRCFSFLIFSYSLIFAIAFTGRYRFAVWALLFFIAILVNEMAQLPLDRWPPMHLVLSYAVVYAHNAVPWSEIAMTWLLIAGFITATLLISLSREGSVITGLYSRMSHHEKVVLVIVGVAIVAAITQIEERKPKPPFRLQQAVRSRDDLPEVSVQHNVGMNEDQAARMSNDLAQTLEEIQDYLDLSALPAVSVIPDSSLDTDVFMMASTQQNDGVVVRAAINSSDFDRTRFDSFVVRQVFEWYSNGHGIPEEQQWLLDGFIQWWLNKRDNQLQLMSLRSVVADQQYPLQVDALEHWVRTREELGNCLGDAMAWRVVSKLSTSLDENAFKSLMRKLFSARPESDARYWIQKPDLYKELTRAGITLSGVVVGAQQQLKTDQALYKATVQNIHWLQVQFNANPMRGKNFEVKYNVDQANTLMFSIRYRELNPWQGALRQTDLARVDASGSGVLPLTLQRGALLFATLEQPNNILRCTMRAGAKRWEVK